MSKKQTATETPNVNETAGRIIMTAVATSLPVALKEGDIALYVGGVKLPTAATFPRHEGGSPVRWLTSTGWGPATQEEWDLVKRSRSTDQREAVLARRSFAQSFLGRLASAPDVVAWGMSAAVARLGELLTEGRTVVLAGFGFSDVHDIRGLVLFHLTKRAKSPFAVWRNDGSSLGPVGAGIVPAIARHWEIS